ncbi:uncharacterized protein N7469_011380 [Penicillium citrinum]|uniref:F-box domain-containing protein n=1 Tax=Penicillium citrinum TaxID=5077 RepID=A0A9W9NDA0_PENCI|nr:uncharacterized protein N7469_011380 [Penicillium citrinum]KAJ5217755.1 hypothetical protein N7469_011380 [Penicillium citrinum]
MEESRNIDMANGNDMRTIQLRLMDLPTELHMQIATHLSYPDALALKHTCRHFYSIVYTGVHLKVDWLVERFERKLECPMEKCSFRTDEAFCNWRIRRIMERRRLHLECRGTAGGCTVIEGETCQADIFFTWLKMQRHGLAKQNMAKWGGEALIVVFLATILQIFWKALLQFGSSPNVA